jgi:hypothetical protein
VRVTPEKANVICREAHERIAEGLKRVPEIVDEAHVRTEQVKRTAAAAAEYGPALVANG